MAPLRLPAPPPRGAPPPPRSRAVLLAAILVAATAAAVLTVLIALLVREPAEVAVTPSPSPTSATTPSPSPTAAASLSADAVVLGGPYTAGRLLIGDVVVLPDDRGEVEVRATVTNPGAALEAVVLEVTLLADGEAFATAATAPLDLAEGETGTPIVFVTFDPHRPDVDEARFRQL